jgi:hypothetical protein
MPFPTLSPWPPLLIALAGIAVGLIAAAAGYPQWGGGVSGAVAFVAMVALGQRGGPGLTRADPPPQIVDPDRIPPMRRGA